MGLLCFSFLLTFVFFCQGRIRFGNWAWPTWLLFCSDPVPFVSCCKFGCLFVCMFFFFILVALHLYIWGNIVLNTCMAFVVIKIVSLVSCFLFVCQRLFVDSIRSFRSISRIFFRLCVIITVDIIHSTERGTGSCCLCSRVCVSVDVCVYVTLSPLRLLGKPINPPGANIGKTIRQKLIHQFKVAATFFKYLSYLIFSFRKTLTKVTK